MGRSTAVVLENQALLAELCGANDENLRLLEELLSTRILYRGNELYVDSEDNNTRTLLMEIVQQVGDEVSSGQLATPDLIRAIHSSIAGDESKTGFLKDASVSISGRNRSVFPRSYAQANYLMGMRERDIVFSIGPAGTGKTYLAVAYALAEILSHRKRKLVLTRPVVEAGESLGYLPGDLAQKISPYLRPLYDAMESLISFETMQRLEEQHIIEIAPLAYMRGRSLNECFVILDEAQNTTREQMMMFLTRLGEGSQAVITGDVTQIDLPKKGNSGLLHAASLLGDIDAIQFSYFTTKDVVRNPLVQKIIDAYEAETE